MVIHAYHLLILAGFGAIGFGLLSLLAAGSHRSMSSGKTGCAFIIGGLLEIVGGIAWWVFS